MASFALISQLSEQFDYSEGYRDGVFHFRTVTMPHEAAQHLPSHLLTEKQWRAAGVKMTRGWKHYATHATERNILLFRRPLGTDPQTGVASDEAMRRARERELQEQAVEALVEAARAKQQKMDSGDLDTR